MTYIPADKEVILESCSIEKDLRSPKASTITVFFSGKTGCGGDAQQPLLPGNKISICCWENQSLID